MPDPTPAPAPPEPTPPEPAPIAKHHDPVPSSPTPTPDTVDTDTAPEFEHAEWGYDVDRIRDVCGEVWRDLGAPRVSDIGALVGALEDAIKPVLIAQPDPE